MDIHLRKTTLVRICALILAFGAFDCVNKPMEPVMPTWDVSLAVPVTDRTYTLEELVAKDTSLLQVAPGGTQLLLKTSAVADPTLVGDCISLDPIASSFEVALGPFSVSTGSATINVQIPGFTPGQTTIIPPVTQVDLPASTGDIPNVESVDIESGSVQLTLVNRMPVELTVDAPVSVVNDVGGSVASFDFGVSPLAPGEERTAIADLAGRSVHKRLRLENMRISSPGSGMTMVTIPDTMILATIVPSGIVASSATVTELESQHISIAEDLPLTAQTLIREVWLNRGSLNIQFVSTVDVPISVRLRLPELYRQNGVSFEQTLAIGPRASASLPVDLAHFRLSSSTGSYLHALRALCDGDIAGSSGTPVTLRSTDAVAVSVTSSSIVADSAVAAIRPTVIAIDEHLGLNLGELNSKFQGRLDIPAADMRFIPQSSIEAPMELNVRFEATDASGGIATLQAPVTKGTQGLSTIAFAPGDVGTFLSRLSGSLPDSLRVVGSVTLNPDYDTTAPSRIGRNCSFGGEVELTVPMSLRLVDGSFCDTLVMGDTTGDGTSERRIDPKTANDINYGKLYVEIDNGLPLGVKATFSLMDRARNTVLMVPQTAGDSIAVASGAVVNGDVQSTTRTLRVIELQGTEIQQFNLADLVRVDLALATAGDQAVNFRTTDRIRVRAWTHFSYRVNQ